MNYKAIGDIGENAVIGKLARLGIGVAIPLSDNYPFDLIILLDKPHRVQVKTSSQGSEGSVVFVFKSNNFYTGVTKKYSKDEVDLLIGYDLRRDEAYLFTHEDLGNRCNVTIRILPSKNGQRFGCKAREDFVLSPERVKQVFGFEVPSWEDSMAIKNPKQFEHVCVVCQKNFVNAQKNAKVCSSKCNGIRQQHVSRPSAEELSEMLMKMSFVQIGRRFSVSDNAIRNWAKSYGLPTSKYEVERWRDSIRIPTVDVSPSAPIFAE